MKRNQNGLRECLEAELAILAVEPVRVLREAGVRGKRHHPCECPVAQYFAHKFQRKSVRVVLGLRLMKIGQRTYVSIPPSLVKFADDFDFGKYPEFEERA